MSVSLGDMAAIVVSLLGLMSSLIATGVAYGSLKQRVISGEAELQRLTDDVGKLQTMAERLVRVETLLTTQNESIRDLTNSLRWLTPARYPHESDEGGNGGRR